MADLQLDSTASKIYNRRFVRNAVQCLVHISKHNLPIGRYSYNFCAEQQCQVTWITLQIEMALK